MKSGSFNFLNPLDLSRLVMGLALPLPLLHNLTGYIREYTFAADKVKLTLYRHGQALKFPRG